jgi:glycogen debranching enzyme
MWSGWGVRTLGAPEAAYDPTSYHCGSVWPHDTAIAVAGLVRYGFAEAAHPLVLGLLDAAQVAHGRLPELLCGIDRRDVSTPVPYPTSCSPQAWAAAAPLLLLRSLLGLAPDVPAGTIAASARLPLELGEVQVRGARHWRGTFDVRAEADAIEIDAPGLRTVSRT